MCAVLLVSQDQENDTSIGDLFTRINNDLNATAEEVEGFPPVKRSLTASGEILKRQQARDSDDVQILQARVVGVSRSSRCHTRLNSCLS
jgi:hypothetical protein